MILARVIFAFLGVLARRWLVACEARSGAICDLPLGICMQWNGASWYPQVLLDVETGRFQEGGVYSALIANSM